MPTPKQDGKHPGGRPLKFKTVEELQEKIDDYLANTGWQKKKVYSKKAGDVIEIEYFEPATIGNLAVALGTNRQTLINYEEREEFFDTIKNAKAKIEAMIEYGGLAGYLPAVPNIFNLKNNFNWKDKQDIEQKGDMNINIVRYGDKDEEK